MDESNLPALDALADGMVRRDDRGFYEIHGGL